MAYALSKYEMETHITWNAEDKIASIWTCDPISIRKLDKLVANHPDVYECVERGNDYAKYRTASKFIRFSKPTSEAQREAARIHAQQLNEKRLSEKQSAT